MGNHSKNSGRPNTDAKYVVNDVFPSDSIPFSYSSTIHKPESTSNATQSNPVNVPNADSSLINLNVKVNVNTKRANWKASSPDGEVKVEESHCWW